MHSRLVTYIMARGFKKETRLCSFSTKNESYYNMPPKGKGKQSSSEGDASLGKTLKKNSPSDVEVTNSDLKKLMASWFEKFESTINQKMSTVETSIGNSLSDI